MIINDYISKHDDILNLIKCDQIKILIVSDIVFLLQLVTQSSVVLLCSSVKSTTVIYQR